MNVATPPATFEQASEQLVHAWELLLSASQWCECHLPTRYRGAANWEIIHGSYHQSVVVHFGRATQTEMAQQIQDLKIEYLRFGCERVIEPPRLTLISDEAGRPLKVVSLCRPFVLVEDPNGQHVPLDLRSRRLARLSGSYGSARLSSLGVTASGVDRCAVGVSGFEQGCTLIHPHCVRGVL